MEKNECSNIKLRSNIMLKSKYEKDSWRYLPPDLLPNYYSDVRLRRSLTESQREQVDKKMFYAEKIIDQ